MASLLLMVADVCEVDNGGGEVHTFSASHCHSRKVCPARSIYLFAGPVYIFALYYTPQNTLKIQSRKLYEAF